MQSKAKLLSKIPLFRLNRETGSPKILPVNLTLSISADCNSRCMTCNIWKKKENDLTIEEWDKILTSLGKAPYWITISGGEPFLQRHKLVELVGLCLRRNKPAIINIPTNCLASAFVPKYTEEILKLAKDIKIVINLSIDGIGEKHDKIRGIPGNYEKAISVFWELKKLKEKYHNLTVGIHSVISNFNYNDIAELYDLVFSLKPDQYITEIAEERAELDTKGMKITPSLENYSKSINGLIAEVKRRKFKGLSRLTESFRLEYYENVKRYLKNLRQPIPCYAGRASGQIYANGDVWQCCVDADVLGNLREYDYNFKKVWFSEKAAEIRKKVKNGGCACPLANASYTNMLLNYKTLAKVSLNYVKK